MNRAQGQLLHYGAPAYYSSRRRCSNCFADILDIVALITNLVFFFTVLSYLVSSFWKQIMNGEYANIRDLKPGMKNLNLIFIILDMGMIF